MVELTPPTLRTAVEAGNTRTVRRLIDEGADINAECLLGLTGLTSACIEGNLEIVDLLINLKRERPGAGDVHILDVCQL